MSSHGRSLFVAPGPGRGGAIRCRAGDPACHLSRTAVRGPDPPGQVGASDPGRGSSARPAEDHRRGPDQVTPLGPDGPGTGPGHGKVTFSLLRTATGSITDCDTVETAPEK